MPTFELTRKALVEIAKAVSEHLDAEARYSERAATDGKLKSLIIYRPFGSDTPYLTLLFPKNLLDVYENLSAADREQTNKRIVRYVHDERCNYDDAFRSGKVKVDDAYDVEFDDRIFTG